MYEDAESQQERAEGVSRQLRSKDARQVTNPESLVGSPEASSIRCRPDGCAKTSPDVART